MKFSVAIVLLPAASVVVGQTQTCTQEMIASDDCAAVIDANACYNEFRWNAQTLQCIDGTDNADRQRKVGESPDDDAVSLIDDRIQANGRVIGMLMLQLRRHGYVQLGEVAKVSMCNLGDGDGLRGEIRGLRFMAPPPYHTSSG